jgi:chemotaxis protein MotB
MKKALTILLSAFVLININTSCVTSKIHNDLKNKHEQLKDQNQLLEEENQMLKAELEDLKDKYSKLERNSLELEKNNADFERKLEALNKDYENIKLSYEQLTNSSDKVLAKNAKENIDLIKQLENSKQLLADENKKLKEKEKKIEELEFLIQQREEYLSSIKDNLSEALRGFEGKGLTVEQKNGKVYVSLENRLLFPSASWEVNQGGQNAIRELSKVLANQDDLNVVIEGHTDSDPYKGGKELADNWDLSVKRATSIVKLILSNRGIDPKRITAAGKSEYLPVSDNKSSAGKSKNRRIEVIIEPDLSKIEAMLQGI